MFVEGLSQRTCFQRGRLLQNIQKYKLFENNPLAIWYDCYKSPLTVWLCEKIINIVGKGKKEIIFDATAKERC